MGRLVRAPPPACGSDDPGHFGFFFSPLDGKKKKKHSLRKRERKRERERERRGGEHVMPSGYAPFFMTRHHSEKKKKTKK